jgi:mono/diheme cytochrome c family protein
MNRIGRAIGIGVMVGVVVIMALYVGVLTGQIDEPVLMSPTVAPTQPLRSVFSLIPTPVSTQAAGSQIEAEKPPTPTPHPELIRQGQRLFYAVGCFYCHGIKAEGAVGPPLARTWLSVDLVIQQVYQPNGDMPVFSPKALTESDVAAIYAYLQSLDESTEVRPKITAKRPNSAAGEALYRYSGCFGCHGYKGEGVFGPTLAGAQLSFEEVRSQVREPEARMPAFGPALISDQELVHIQAFLQSLSP